LVGEIQISACEGKMQMSYVFKMLVALLFFNICGVSLSKADCPTDAQEIVEQFFKYDYEGYRLSSEGHQAIWNLTDGNGEPPEEPLSVTKDFKIISIKKQKDTCRLTVRFSLYGQIVETGNGLVFRQRASEEDGSVIVRCKNGSCRISLDLKDFRLGPHPGKDAVMKWLDKLESIQTTSEQKQRYRTLREQIGSL